MNNDDVILQLKKKIEEKKKLIRKSEKFQPVTNCSLELNGQRYNLHVISEEIAIGLLIIMNILENSAAELDFTNVFKISGYTPKDWMDDLYSKLNNLKIRSEQVKLSKMEERLTQLLSNDKRVELELQDIIKDLE